MSVGRRRWTWRSTCSTACRSWDARSTSASPDPDGVGGSAPAPMIHAPRCRSSATAGGVIFQRVLRPGAWKSAVQARALNSSRRGLSMKLEDLRQQVRVELAAVDPDGTADPAEIDRLVREVIVFLSTSAEDQVNAAARIAEASPSPRDQQFSF